MFSCTSSMPCNLPVRCGFGTVSSWCVSCLSMALFFLECLWSAACKQNNGTSRSCASRFARSTMLRAMFSQYMPMTWPCLNKSVVSSFLQFSILRVRSWAKWSSDKGAAGVHVAQWNLQSRRRAFPQHKRLWRIARRIYSIYAAISLHSSQRQRLHQTTAAQISQCHPSSWHQMAMISLPWLLKHKTFPVKTSSVPMCSNFPSAKRQCPSCSVKLHLQIYIVCNLSNLSQWNISKRYTYYIYSLKHFMSLSFEHYYLIQVSACAWALVGCCGGCQSTSCFPNHLSNTFESSHWPMCLLPLKLLACAALADWSPAAITCQANKNTQEDITDHTTSSCWILLWWCPSGLWPAIE